MVQIMSMARKLVSNLVRLAEAYRGRIPQTLQNVSYLMANDSGLFRRISTTDAGFTVTKYDQVVQEFSNYWPDDLEWPEGVDRPRQAEKKVQTRNGKPLIKTVVAAKV